MESRDWAPPMDFRDYIGVLRRRKLVILMALVVVVASAITAAKLHTPEYRATASILIQDNANQALFNQNSSAQAINQTTIATQIQIIRSQPVKSSVQAKFGSAPPISVSQVGQTNVISVSATSTDPASSAIAANAYANAYIDSRRTQDVDSQLAAAQQIQARITDLQTQINSLNAQIAAGGKEAQTALSAQIDSLIQEEGAFKQQLGQVEVLASLNTGGAQLVSPAKTPTAPASPQPKRDAILAVFAGILLGVGLAFLLEYLDDSIKSKDDLDRVAQGHPNLGLIPRLADWKTKTEPVLVSITDPASPAAEAYRALRTAIQFASLERPLHTIQVTSSSAAEGKTTTLANLAVTLAQAGNRVIVTCCDLRRPRLQEFFQLDNSIGFTSVLLGEFPLSQALQSVPDYPNLRVLASGPLPPNPSELLASGRSADVIAALRSHADFVLLDSPPLLPVTDAVLLSARADATLLVAMAGSTTRKELARSIEILTQVDAPLIGTVLNGVTMDGSYGYAYQYYYRNETSPASLRRPQEEDSKSSENLSSAG